MAFIATEEIIDRLIKQAEYFYGKNPMVSSLLDKAFERIAKVTDGYYQAQDQTLAMFRMLRSWYAREYTGISKNTVLSLIASVIYVANPLDLIPDFIPYIGKIDDRMVINYMTKRLNVEIQRYMTWETEQGLA